MWSHHRIQPHVTPADSVSAIVLLFVAVACASTDAARIDIDPPRMEPRVVYGLDRLLVAGFIADVVPDRHGTIDVNQETTRVLQTELRAKAALQVIQAEPLRLEVPQPAFGPASFWRRVGEEYGQPLILTGTVEFKRAGSRYEERMAGRRTRRIWLPVYSLTGTVVLIDGRTGEPLDSVMLRRFTAAATSTQASALSVYYRLMDQAMPAILDLFGHKAARERVLLR